MYFDTKKYDKPVMIVVIICTIVLLLIVNPLEKIEIKNGYNAAWDLAINGKYSEAKDKFRDLQRDYYGKSIYTSSMIFGEEF